MSLKTIGVRKTVHRVSARNPMTRKWHLMVVTYEDYLTATKGWRYGRRQTVESTHASKPWIVTKMPRTRHLGEQPMLRTEQTWQSR